MGCIADYICVLRAVRNGRGRRQKCDDCTATQRSVTWRHRARSEIQIGALCLPELTNEPGPRSPPGIALSKPTSDIHLHDTPTSSFIRSAASTQRARSGVPKTRRPATQASVGPFLVFPFSRRRTHSVLHRALLNGILRIYFGFTYPIPVTGRMTAHDSFPPASSP